MRNHSQLAPSLSIKLTQLYVSSHGPAEASAVARQSLSLQRQTLAAEIEEVDQQRQRAVPCPCGPTNRRVGKKNGIA